MRTWSTIVKAAVVAPMPMAAIAIAVTANPGERPSARAAYRRSCRRTSHCTATAFVRRSGIVWSHSAARPKKPPASFLRDAKTARISPPYSARHEAG